MFGVEVGFWGGEDYLRLAMMPATAKYLFLHSLSRSSQFFSVGCLCRAYSVPSVL